MDGPSTRLHVRVSPGATRTRIVGRHGQAWKVRVAAAPERGKANVAVIDLLAEALELPPSRIAVVTGHSARDKVVAVEGLSGSEAERRLAVAVGRD